VTTNDIDQAKRDARERTWAALERASAAPPGVRGHIPDFAGKAEAAARLAQLDEWGAARTIKINPDKAQLPVRIQALQDGKLVYMAVPRLATPKPFYLLDPTALPAAPELVATGSGAAGHASTVAVDEMRPVDLVICGSVVLNTRGVRVGKGAGYSDIEFALLAEAGLVGPATVIATTVHELQVTNIDLPETAHDFSVDLIVTPDRSVRCAPPRRPTGIMAERLGSQHLAEIPVLAARRR
jgi:5-formyltetrahydrofolate cyclo-ligase